MLIGYARVSMGGQDAGFQRAALLGQGIEPERIYVDEDSTGRNTARPALAKALETVRARDELVVTKLDRLARSGPYLRSMLDGLHGRALRVRIDRTVYYPADPMGRLVNVLAMVGEIEADLISARTKAGMDVARRKGRMQRKAAKLNAKQTRHLAELYDAQTHSAAELAELFGISVATVHRTRKRAVHRAQSN